MNPKIKDRFATYKGMFEKASCKTSLSWNDLKSSNASPKFWISRKESNTSLGVVCSICLHPTHGIITSNWLHNLFSNYRHIATYKVVFGHANCKTGLSWNDLKSFKCNTIILNFQKGIQHKFRSCLEYLFTNAEFVWKPHP